MMVTTLTRMSAELQTGVWIILHWIILQELGFLSVVADLCTKAVPVVQSPAKRIHVLRRVPAACSNWDKSWAWLTKVDCGTKYKLDYVTVPPRDAVTYRLKYVCCKGDEECQNASDLQSAGLSASDEKFLAIILGSTAAAVLILVIIITISLCHKRRRLRCPVICEERSHIYETAEDIDEVGELDREGNICVEECGTRIIESEYEEIRDCKARTKQYEDNPPRYADLFNVKGKPAQHLGPESGDSFEKATAPPLICEDSDLVRESTQNSNKDIHEVLSGTAKILEAENSVQCSAIIEDCSEKSYYNCSLETCTMPERVLQSDDSVILGEKPQTVNCSNYESLNPRDTEDGHQYETLVDISVGDNDVKDNDVQDNVKDNDVQDNSVKDNDVWDNNVKDNDVKDNYVQDNGKDNNVRDNNVQDNNVKDNNTQDNDNDVPDNDVHKSLDHSPCTVDTTPQPPLTMNGHIEAASC